LNMTNAAPRRIDHFSSFVCGVANVEFLHVSAM
jgi:hypothetical protein